MAKKNKTSKKHRFKYAEPTAPTANRPVSATNVSTPTTNTPSAPAGSTAKGGSASASATTISRDYSYVFTDLRRLGLLAAGLIVFELGLWYLVSHTGFGGIVYNLLKF